MIPIKPLSDAQQIAQVEIAQLKAKITEIEQAKSADILQMRSGTESLGGPNSDRRGRQSIDEEVERLRIENRELHQKFRELIESIKSKRRNLQKITE